MSVYGMDSTKASQTSDGERFGFSLKLSFVDFSLNATGLSLILNGLSTD